MKINFDDLVKDALELKASYAAIADASKIKFHEDYRKACEKNVCRKYDTNWMGPPAIGPINELMDKVRKYKQGLLIQTAHKLSSSFDYKGMIAAGKVHGEIFRKVLDNVKNKHKLMDILPLNAGCCDVCERCTYLDGEEKCRFPDRALSSVEAYGIDVMALEKSAGIPYYNGPNTVSYVGLILFNENRD
jgi:predicted metal-binding protein